jgi:hypothetical protein
MYYVTTLYHHIRPSTSHPNRSYIFITFSSLPAICVFSAGWLVLACTVRPIAVLLVPSSFSVPFCFPNTLPLVGAAHLLGFAFLDGVRGVSKDSIRGGLRGRFEGLFALKGCLNRGGKVVRWESHWEEKARHLRYRQVQAGSAWRSDGMVYSQ